MVNYLMSQIDGSKSQMDKECGKKRKWRTLEAAKKAARWDKMKTYPCVYCGFYHVGH